MARRLDPSLQQAVRYLLLGGVNTSVSYAVLVAAAFVLPARLAYTLAFALGLLLNAGLTGRVVFGSRPSGARRAAYVAWHLVAYLLGLLVVTAGVRAGVRSPFLIGLLPLLVTVPFGFLGARVLLAPPAPLPVSQEVRP